MPSACWAFGPTLCGGVVQCPGQQAARGEAVHGGGAGAAGQPAEQLPQRITPLALSGSPSGPDHHFDGWQRCACPATAVLESHTHGLPQLTRASVVFKQVAQLPEGAASTQHATSLPPSRQPRADGG